MLEHGRAAAVAVLTRASAATRAPATVKVLAEVDSVAAAEAVVTAVVEDVEAGVVSREQDLTRRLLQPPLATSLARLATRNC